MAIKDDGKAEGAAKARVVDSDAPAQTDTQVSADEPEYVVDGKSVSREEYIKALPKAGYVPERMPANFYPALSTK